MTAAPLPDPYAILGVTPDASDDDLDRAFRRLVRQLHPDTRTPSGPDSGLGSGADADRRLQEILTAYATLRDPVAHDRTNRPATTNIAPTPPPSQPRGSAAGPRPGIDLRIGPVQWSPLPRGPGRDPATRDSAR
jgi:hypothetical protein